MPVTTGTSQTRDIDAEHQTDMAEPNISNETLEAGSMQRRRCRAAEIVINDDPQLMSPSELAGTIRQRVLQPGGLLVLQHLAHRRLSDIDNRLSLTVSGLDFVRG
jgi:hypothetical protein